MGMEEGFGGGGGGGGFSDPSVFGRGRGRNVGGGLGGGRAAAQRGRGGGREGLVGGRGRGPITFTPPPASSQAAAPAFSSFGGGGKKGLDEDPIEKERLKAERARRFQDHQGASQPSPQPLMDEGAMEASEPVAPYSPSPFPSPSPFLPSSSPAADGGSGQIVVRRFAPGQSPFAQAVAAAQQRPSSFLVSNDAWGGGGGMDDDGDRDNEEFIQASQYYAIHLFVFIATSSYPVMRNSIF